MSTSEGNIKIITGEDRNGTRPITIRLTSESNGLPFDLTGVTEITVCFKNADSTDLSKTIGSGVTVTNAAGGQFKVELDDLETALLNIGDNQNIEVAVEFGTQKTIIQLLQVLNVVEALC